MSSIKEATVVIDDTEKESISARLRQLIGVRTVRAAAREWGLSFSTLNNYLTRGTEPSLNVAIKIANVEGVSVEWLATGMETSRPNDESPVAKSNIDGQEFRATPPLGADVTTTSLKDERFLALTWGMFFEALSPQEKERIVDVYVQIGTRGVMAILNNVNELTTEWMKLSHNEQERLLRLNEQLKKGAPEVDRGVAEPGSSSSSKKAG